MEIRGIIKRLKGGKSPGPSGLRVDTIKIWSQETETPNNHCANNWESLETLIKDIFETGQLPSSMCYQTLVMILKEDQGQYRGIGLIEKSGRW